jgi:hypothetical protein
MPAVVRLSLPKPRVVASLLFQKIMIVFVFHFFLLKEKSGAKKFKASPNRSARIAGPRTAIPNFLRSIHLLPGK